MDLMMMERVGDRWKKMEGYCSTGQSPQQAAVEEEEGGGGGGGKFTPVSSVLHCTVKLSGMELEVNSFFASPFQR
jgi:hypothetical protein